MKIRLKSKIQLALAAVLGLVLSCNATAAKVQEKARASRHVQTCVAEIASHANYNKGSRVIHWVTSIKQEDYSDMRIGIETTVYLRDDDMDRKYRTSCVIDTSGKLVRFRFRTDDREPPNEHLGGRP